MPCRARGAQLFVVLCAVVLLPVEPWATTVREGYAEHPPLILGAVVVRPTGAGRAVACPAIALAMLALSVLQNHTDDLCNVQREPGAENPRE